ncbi:MAG: hypothetical protein FWD31_11390 [Planctomycetaceae bacterium]|nr:hypothetical protein [Planctomycetaceae bacterium]
MGILQSCIFQAFSVGCKFVHKGHRGPEPVEKTCTLRWRSPFFQFSKKEAALLRGRNKLEAALCDPIGSSFCAGATGQGAALCDRQQMPLAQQQMPLAQQQMPLAQQQMPLAQQQMPLAQQQMPLAQQQCKRTCIRENSMTDQYNTFRFGKTSTSAHFLCIPLRHSSTFSIGFREAGAVCGHVVERNDTGRSAGIVFREPTVLMCRRARAYSKLVWSHKGNKVATNGSGKLQTNFQTGLVRIRVSGMGLES